MLTQYHRAMKVKALVAAIQAGGGFTVHPKTLEAPTTGYMVGFGGSIPWEKSEVDARVINNHLYAAEERGGDRYYGGWVDGNLVYLEQAQRFEDRELALAAARERGEKAIYDLTTQTEIRV